MDATLAELEDVFRTVGAAAFRAQWKHPVLIRQDLVESDEESSFDTRFMSRDTLDLDRAASEAELEEPERVHAVFKPAGKPFQERIGLGRAPNADVNVRLPRISKYHGFFTTSEDGSQYFFTDAGSKNGTRIDGEQLEPRRAYPIRDGSSIHLGPYEFTFHLPDALAELVASRAGAR